MAIRGAVSRGLKRFLTRDARSSNYKFLVKDWTRLVDLNASSQVLETKRFAQNLRPVEIDAPGKKRILVIAPHPDDDTFGAGATLIKAIDRGSRVHVAYVTDGSSDPRQAALIRSEAGKVCSALGAEHTFLGLPPKGIPIGDSQASAGLVSLVRDQKPDAIFITFLLDDHDDHRRVNDLLLSLHSDLDLRGIEVWAYQIYSTVIPNVVVDITRQADAKRELIRMWRSVSGNRDWAHYILGMNAANCRYIPSREPVYAEAFFVVPIEEYLDLCRIYFSRPRPEIYSTGWYAELETMS